MFDLQHYLDNNIRLINTALDRRLPAESERPAALHKAMRYSVFAGGKRVRPMTTLLTTLACGGDPLVAVPLAAAAELEKAAAGAPATEV